MGSPVSPDDLDQQPELFQPMTHANKNTPNDTETGEARTKPEKDAPVRSAATQRWLDAVVEALNRLDGDEAMRRRGAKRIF